MEHRSRQPPQPFLVRELVNGLVQTDIVDELIAAVKSRLSVACIQALDGHHLEKLQVESPTEEVEDGIQLTRPKIQQ